MTETQDLIARLRVWGAFDPGHIDNAAADALEAAQGEIEEWKQTFDGMMKERDAALARIAEIGGQEPVAWAKSTERKLRITVMDMAGEDGWSPLFYDTRALCNQPVQPNQAASDIVYTVALQRAIETHCGGKTIPESASAKCPHHAKMLNDMLAQPSQARDAARYRWLRSTTNWASNSNNERIDVRNSPEVWDSAIDAAINAKGAT